MSFTITIDFDLTPEDLALLKAIGERANTRWLGDIDKHSLAVKELLRELLELRGFKREALERLEQLASTQPALFATGTEELDDKGENE